MSNCAICSEPTNLEVKLTCQHVACYLCVKKLINDSLERCPSCNKKFKKNILEQEIDPNGNVIDVAWYYGNTKGNSWWLFDPISCEKLESMYDQFINDPKYNYNDHSITIAGIEYVYDFANMNQRSEHGKIRKIKREINSHTDKALGIAGAKYTTTINID